MAAKANNMLWLAEISKIFSETNELTERGFGEEAWNVKSLQTTDDGRQVMAIVHMDLRFRWTKKDIIIFICKPCSTYRIRNVPYIYSRFKTQLLKTGIM
jgi:hypothetical protein